MKTSQRSFLLQRMGRCVGAIYQMNEDLGYWQVEPMTKLITHRYSLEDWTRDSRNRSCDTNSEVT